MIKLSTILLFIIVIGTACFGQWTPQTSSVTARLRGVSVVDEAVAWASGSKGTCLRTTDGGNTWRSLRVPDAANLDFRDVDAFDANTAYLLSIGEGENSRIYKTTDGGEHWTLQFTNHNPKAFFDAMAFWDARNGIAVSDPVEGRFLIMRTSDGGETWKPAPFENMPPAVLNEGAFAASGSCITVQGRSNAWFATGGAASARVFRSTDRGETWSVAPTPIVAGKDSAGIFSIAFSDAKNGIVVGGDYRKEQETGDNVALTNDGGRTWKLANGSKLGGFRSGVAYAPGSSGRLVIAVGPAGTEYSKDGGTTWAAFEGSGGYDAISFGKSKSVGWAAGQGGRIGKYSAGKLP